MPISTILDNLWRWLADTGLNLAILIVVALLIPRAGRLVNRFMSRNVHKQADGSDAKSRLAVTGVIVYLCQLIAFFVVLVFFLQQLGFSMAGAAIPATVVSAAIGFGAQSIIADFLSGFFILSEKQYGVGDWVSFQGNGVDVTGDVIQITMRSTQIRQMDQSTVTIPNSTAAVCINASNIWSRALVVIPVPLLGSNSAEEVLARTERASRKAIADPEIAGTLVGDLIVQPALDVNPPATVGMPWTVDMRIMVRVSPGDQWAAERAIRVAVLNEFWAEYGSATTVDGMLIDDLEAALEGSKTTKTAQSVGTPVGGPASAATGPITWQAPASQPTTSSGQDGSPALANLVAKGAAANEGEDEPSVEETPTAYFRPVFAPNNASYFEASDIESMNRELKELKAKEKQSDDGSATDPAAQDAALLDGDDTSAEAAPTEKKKGRVLATLGGRVRASTVGLLVTFVALLILRGLMWSDEEEESGVFAPPPVTTPEPAPEQVTPVPEQPTVATETPTYQPEQNQNQNQNQNYDQNQYGNQQYPQQQQQQYPQQQYPQQGQPNAPQNGQQQPQPGEQEQPQPGQQPNANPNQPQ